MMTVAFCGFTLALVLLLRLAPSSPAARLLHRQLVEAPLEKLAKLRSHHLLYVAILPVLMLGGWELLAAAGSVDFIMVYAMDLAIYFDAMLVTYALAAVAMARGSLRYTRLRLRKGSRVRRLLAARRRRSAPARRALPSANDDDRPAALPLAA
jgi:hypothetical protein